MTVPRRRGVFGKYSYTVAIFSNITHHCIRITSIYIYIYMYICMYIYIILCTWVFKQQFLRYLLSDDGYLRVSMGLTSLAFDAVKELWKGGVLRRWIDMVVYVHIQICLYVYLYIYNVYKYIYIYTLCIYIYIYILCSYITSIYIYIHVFQVHVRTGHFLPAVTSVEVKSMTHSLPIACSLW